ncbi:hypothetical protein PVAG01_04389 [Phlyctema vagabunda]|uniref:DUF7918 domain-containing protein n=1 Tax=Phlyctema vagabunda TaxID=108571 RepID=A0ABR4PPH8_9HELO
MAVLDEVPGVKVQLLIKGRPVKEYENKHEQLKDDDDLQVCEPAPTITRYVESVTDEEFAIKVAIRKPYKMDCPALACDILMDGVTVRTRVLRKSRYETDGELKDCTIGTLHKYGENFYLKKFKFAEIKTSTDESKLDSIKADSRALSKIGEIVLRITKVTEDPVPVKRLEQPPHETNSIGEVHEKAQKGDSKSHGILLGAPKLTSESDTFKITRSKTPDALVAVFVFRYRSLKSLKELLIVQDPRGDKANMAQSQAGLDLDGLNEGQKDQMKQLLQNFLNENKAQTVESTSPSTPKVIRERARAHGNDTTCSAKKPKRERVEIDLTED